MIDQTLHIDTSYRIEIVRKAIHLCSLSIPVLYFFISRDLALFILVPLTLAFVTIDVARYRSGPIQRWFYGTFSWILRRHESDSETRRLNGATFVLIAATLSVLIFPKIIAVVSFAVLIMGDLTAALIGRRFGKHRFMGGKSIEGSLGFIVAGMLVIFVTPKIAYVPAEYAVGIIAVIVGAFAEAVSTRIDDNLSIPLSVGATMWIAYAYMLPGLNVYQFG